MDKFNSWLSTERDSRELVKILKLLSKTYITRACFFYVEYCYSHHSTPDDEIIQILIDHGSDPEYKDLLYNKKPLTLAFENGDPDAIDALVRNGADLFYLDKNKDTYLTLALPSFKKLSDEKIKRVVMNYKYKFSFLSTKNNYGKSTFDEILDAYDQTTREYEIIYKTFRYDCNDHIVKKCIKLVSEETGVPIEKVRKILEKECEL